MSKRFEEKGKQIAQIQLIGSLITGTVGLLIFVTATMANKFQSESIDMQKDAQNKIEHVNKLQADSVIVQKMR